MLRRVAEGGSLGRIDVTTTARGEERRRVRTIRVAGIVVAFTALLELTAPAPQWGLNAVYGGGRAGGRRRAGARRITAKARGHPLKDPMKEAPPCGLVKSALTLPWAISMLGVQQVSNLLAPPSKGRLAGTTDALDTVSDVTAQQLDGWLKQTYNIGTSMQTMLVDLMMFRTPEFDQSVPMHMAAEIQDGPMFQAVIEYGLPPLGWLDSFLVSRRDAPGAVQEFYNKLQIIMLVTHVHAELGLDANTVDSLYVLVDRSARCRRSRACGRPRASATGTATSRSARPRAVRIRPGCFDRSAVRRPGALGA